MRDVVCLILELASLLVSRWLCRLSLVGDGGMVAGDGGPIPRAVAAPSASRRPAEPRTRLAALDARLGHVAPVGFIATDSASLSSPLEDIVGRLATAAPGTWSVSPLAVVRVTLEALGRRCACSRRSKARHSEATDLGAMVFEMSEWGGDRSATYVLGW
ncbi:hypothetical protein AYO39_03025 [Actinobacteria bacterium SCGC AG-212-D09]|nr:hypothetical protein AYO39_03025 [Actinobacteria bacterium SCGC AG-212-D09]